eukprot:6183817-Amphidinium_carterae.1
MECQIAHNELYLSNLFRLFLRRSIFLAVSGGPKPWYYVTLPQLLVSQGLRDVLRHRNATLQAAQGFGTAASCFRSKHGQPRRR